VASPEIFMRRDCWEIMIFRPARGRELETGEPMGKMKDDDIPGELSFLILAISRLSPAETGIEEAGEYLGVVVPSPQPLSGISSISSEMASPLGERSRELMTFHQEPFPHPKG